MLHGIIIEQGFCLHVRDHISIIKYYFHIFSYKSLATGALILWIIVIADNKPMTCVIDVIIYIHHIFPNAYRSNNKIYRGTNRK